MFWCFGRKICGIFAPWPGIKSTPPSLEGEALTTGLPGKSPPWVLHPTETSSPPKPKLSFPPLFSRQHWHHHVSSYHAGNLGTILGYFSFSSIPLVSACFSFFLLFFFVIYCMSQCTYLLSLTLIQSYSNLSFTRIRGIFLNIKLFMSVPWLKVCPSAPVTSSWKLKATLRSFDSHVLAPNSCQPLHSHFPSFLPLNLMFYPQETDYDSLNLPDSHLPLLTCFSLCLEGSTSLFLSQDFSTWLTFFLAWAN